MSRFSKIAGILAITAILFAGCSKSSGPTSASSTNAPKLAAPVFKGPGTSATGADTSFGALTVNGLAATFTSVSAGYSALFAQAGAPKQSGSTWTWSINGSGYTITFSATQSDTTYQWKDFINGNYQGTSYSKWTAFTGSETESGANGDWTLYNQNKTTLFATVNWTTDASGNLTGSIVTYDSTGAQSGKPDIRKQFHQSGPAWNRGCCRCRRHHCAPSAVCALVCKAVVFARDAATWACVAVPSS